MNDDGESGDQIFIPSDDFNPEFSKDLTPQIDPLSLSFNFNGSNEHGIQCKYCNIRHKDFHAAVNHSCMPFRCIQCATAFLYDYQLKMHKCSKKNSERTDSVCSVTQEDSLCICSVCGSTFADSKLLSNHNCAKKKNKNCQICGKILSSKCLGVYCGGCKKKAKNNKYSLRHKNPLSVSSTSLSELSSNDATNSSSETQNAFNACNQLKKIIHDFHNGVESSDLSESNASSAVHLSKKRRRVNGSGKLSKRKSKQNVLGGNSDSTDVHQVDSHETQSLYPKSKKRASISKSTKKNSTSKDKDEECDILSNNAALCNDISKSSTVISNSEDKFGKMRYSLRCEKVNKIAPSLFTSETSESHKSDNTSENNSPACDELEKAAEIDSTAVSNSNNQDIDLSVPHLPKRKKSDVASKISEDGNLENNCEDNESVKLSDTIVNNVPRNKNWTAKGKRNRVFKRSGRNNVRFVERKLSNALTSSDCANSIESTDDSISDSVHLSAGDTDVDGQTAGCNVQESRIPPVNQIPESRDSLSNSNKILMSTEKNPTSKSKDILNIKESNMNEIRLTEKSSCDSNECVTTASLQKSDKGNSNILLSTLQTKEKVIAQKIIPNNISKFKHKRLPKEQISEALAIDSSQPSTSRFQKQVSCVKRKRAATPSDGSFGANSTQKVTFSCEPSADACSKTKKQTIPCSTLSRAPVPAGNSIFATSNFPNTVADSVGVRKQKSTSSTSHRKKFPSDNVHGKGKNVPIFNSSRNFGTHTSSIKSDSIIPNNDRNSIDPQRCPNLTEIVSLEVLFKALPNYGAVVSKVLSDGCVGYRCPKCNHIFRQIKKATDHSRICQIFKVIRRTSISIQEVEFVCTSCYQHWSSLDELYNHKKYCPVLLIKNNVQISDFIHSYDKANKNYVCPKCSYSCLSSYKFSQHPCQKRLESMKTCFVKVEKLSEQEVGSEENVFKIVCPTCQSVFSDFIEFENHSKLHINVGLNNAKSQVDRGKAYVKKEIKKVITNNKNCSSVEDMMKMILEPVSEILASMDSNNAFPDFNLDIPLPYEQQKLFNEAVKQVLTDADENTDSVDKTSNAQELIGLENLLSKDCNSEGHTSSTDNDDTFMKDFRCKCTKDTLDPKIEKKPCLKCLNDYMLSKLNESSKDFTLSAPVTAPTSAPSNCGSSISLASCSDLFRNLASCSSFFPAVSSIGDFITTEAPVSGSASRNSESPVVLSSVSLAPPESQSTSSPRSSTVIQDTEENVIPTSFSSKGDSNITSDVVPEENRIAPNTSENNTNVTDSTETSIPCQKTTEQYATSTFTFTNADECSSSTQSDCKIVYCYLPPNSAFSLDQKQTNVELISEIKPEETFGTEFENMLPIVKVIQDESKTDKVVLYPKIDTDCKNSVKRKLYMEKLSKMCHNLIIKSELLQPLKPEVLESCRCKNALCDCNRVPSPQLCEKDQAYLVLDDTQSAPLSDRKIIYWVFEKLMDQFLKEENDFSVSFVMFPPFGVTVSIDWYLDPDTAYSVYALKDTMQFICGSCVQELSVSSLLEHVIEKHKETVINILIA